MSTSQSEREKVFAKVRRLVGEKHFNPGSHGVDWDELAAQRAQEILRDPEQFEKRVHSLLAELHTSHTGFFHMSNRLVPAPLAINATLKSCPVAGELNWVFQDVHEGGVAHAAGIRPGDLLVAVDDKRLVPPNVPVFRMGGSSTASVQRPSGVVNRVRIDVPKPKSSRHPVNVPRAVAHLSLPSQVGYLKINMFPGVIGIDFAKEVEAAIAGLSMCDRLVIDLRGNTGGGIGGLRVMSYLTPDKLPIGFSLTRRRAQSGYKREELRRFGRIPSTKAALPWLIVKYGMGDKSICLYTEGLGSQKFHGKVVLLVNEHSVSAAEMLAAFAAENNLAKIVGTKTAGRLLSGSAFRVGHGYILVLPTAAYLTWSGRSLEGTGITPDVEIDATYESLRAGEDVQLQKATEIVMQM